VRTSYYRRAITLQGGADALQLTPPIASRRKHAALKLDRTRRNLSRCTPRTKIFLRTVCVSHLVLSPFCFPASDTRPTDHPSNLVSALSLTSFSPCASVLPNPSSHSKSHPRHNSTPPVLRDSTFLCPDYKCLHQTHTRLQNRRGASWAIQCAHNNHLLSVAVYLPRQVYRSS
jgi:hypothetical protein